MKAAIILILAMISATNSVAQNFTPIGGGYDCMTLANGEQFLVVREDSSFTLMNDKAAVKNLIKKRTAITQRISTLRELKASIRRKKPNSHALRIFRRLWKLTTGSALDSSMIDTRDERIETLNALMFILNEEKKNIASTVASINGCKQGRKSFPKGGILMYPSVKVIGLVGHKRQYSGWMIHDVALKTKYTVKPGGYNGCLKFYWKSGGTTTLMSGLGTKPCYTGSVNKFDAAVAACNKSLPKGRVGFALQHGSSIDMDQSTLDFLVASAVENKPGVVFLRKPDDVPYDKFAQDCAKWNN